jgi:HAD superfamily hydrolase (TIGR01459 family)
MTAPRLLDRLSDIAADYDAILCDVWGVIHDGRRAFGAACEALKKFREERGPVILVTNAPVPRERVTRLAFRIGVPSDCFDDVATSGEATRHELEAHAPGPVYAIGLNEDRSVYEGLPLVFTDDPDQARIVSCTSLREFPNGHPETYREELTRLAQRGLPMVCANPDLQFRHGDQLIWSAGALAQIYESLGGSVVRPGKPDRPIYELAFEKLEQITGDPVAHDRTLAIGDGPATDMRGAMNQGMHSLFIGGGIHGHKLTSPEDFLEDAVRLLDEDRVTAQYAMPELAW